MEDLPMIGPSPFPASVLRPPSPAATCSCEHWVHCVCACHGLHCDPSESACDPAFLPDDGGLTTWGCRDCTPGVGLPHDLGCQLIGWSIPYTVPATRSGR
jgi:hypothetical protein